MILWELDSAPPQKKTKSKKEPTALIGGISFCSGQQLIKNCNWSKNWEKNWVFMFSPKWDIYINLPPTAEGTSQQRDRKERKSQRMGKSSMKDGLLELAWHALVSSSRQSMFQWMEEALTTLPHTHTLPEELLAADGCWVKEKQCSVVDCLCPHGSPHPCAYWQH